MQHKFFITGGLGYIGSLFAQEALKKGHAVVLYDSFIYEQNHKKIIDEIISGQDKSKFSLIIGDTRNKGLLELSIKTHQPSIVLHFGELVGVYACEHNPDLTEDVNFNGSKNVVDICSKFNIPLIYNSSSSLYGNQKVLKLLKEDDELPGENDSYCKYKLLMEKYIQKKMEENPKFNAIIFRPATVCGISPRMRIELIINHFTYCAFAKKNIKVAKPDSCRAVIDIRDLISGYFKVIEKENWKRLIYNIGHYNLSKIEYTKRIQEIVPCDIVPLGEIGDARNLQIDCSALESEFSFKPEIDYKDTVASIVEWLKKNTEAIEKNNFIGILNMSLKEWEKII